MNGWQDIATAPRDGTWILTISQNTIRSWTIPGAMRWTGAYWEIEYPDMIVYHQPMYWMPLPAPPEGEG